MRSDPGRFDWRVWECVVDSLTIREGAVRTMFELRREPRWDRRECVTPVVAIAGAAVVANDGLHREDVLGMKVGCAARRPQVIQDGRALSARLYWDF